MEALARAWDRVVAGEPAPTDDVVRSRLLARARNAGTVAEEVEREHAVVVAARIGGFRGFGVVRSFLKDPSSGVRMLVVSLAAEGGADGLASLRDAAADPDPTVARSALELLIERADPGATAQARRALSHPDPKVREAAVRLLGRVGGPALGPVLEGMRADPDPAVAAAATEARAGRGARPARPLAAARAPSPAEGLLLRAGVADDASWPGVRAELAAARPAALHAAGRSATDSVARLGWIRAAEALERRDWAAGLKPLLRDAAPGVRCAAAAALGRLAGASVVPALIGALSDPEPAVRRAAVDALGVVGGPASWSAARAALGHDADEGVRSAVARLAAADATLGR